MYTYIGKLFRSHRALNEKNKIMNLCVCVSLSIFKTPESILMMYCYRYMIKVSLESLPNLPLISSPRPQIQ